MRLSKFSASNGQLEGFEKRNDLCFKTVCEESSSVNPETCRQQIQDLSHHIADYSADDVFNADETDLFFKCLPDKTFTFKGANCNGGKISKERVTILLCCNMSGTEKLSPLLIGKPKSPRSFKKEWLLNVNKQLYRPHWYSLSDE